MNWSARIIPAARTAHRAPFSEGRPNVSSEPSFSLDGKTFTSAVPSSGEVDEATRFRYHQNGELIWADYAGGAIAHGHLVGTRAGDALTFRYAPQHCPRDCQRGLPDADPNPARRTPTAARNLVLGVQARQR